MRRSLCWLVVAHSGLGCSTAAAPGPAQPAPQAVYSGGEAFHSRTADRALLEIPAGTYVAGSTAAERARAYGDYLATSGRDHARKYRWFEREEPRHLARSTGQMDPPRHRWLSLRG